MPFVGRGGDIVTLVRYVSSYEWIFFICRFSAFTSRPHFFKVLYFAVLYHSAYESHFTITAYMLSLTFGLLSEIRAFPAWINTFSQIGYEFTSAVAFPRSALLNGVRTSNKIPRSCGFVLDTNAWSRGEVDAKERKEGIYME